MKSVLYIQTAFVGDLLLAIPCLKNLKREFPGVKISLICRKGLGEFLKKTEYIDEFFEYDKKDKSSVSQIVSKIEELSFDLVVCPHESLTSVKFVRAVTCDKKIGFKKWWNKFFFTDRVKKSGDLPEALRQLSLLTVVKKSVAKSIEVYRKKEMQGNVLLPEIHDPISMEVAYFMSLKKNKALADYNGPLAELSDYVVMAPGSVWNTKRWTEEGFVEVARQHISKGEHIVLVGSPEESELCEKILNQIESELVINMAGKTSLWEVAEIISRSKIIYCNDSGAMHLASLSSTPSVSIFGPTVLEFGYRPWNNNAQVVQKEMDCRPCGLHGHKKCPLRNHRCMTSIDSQEVINAGRALLK